MEDNNSLMSLYRQEGLPKSETVYLMDGSNALIYVTFAVFSLSLISQMHVIHTTFAVFGEWSLLRRRFGKAAFILACVTAMDLLQGMIATLSLLKLLTYSGGLWYRQESQLHCYVPSIKDLPFASSIVVVATWTTMLRYILSLAMFRRDPEAGPDQQQSPQIGDIFYYNAKVTLVVAGFHFLTLAVVQYVTFKVGICFNQVLLDPTQNLLVVEFYVQACLPVIGVLYLVTWLIKDHPDLKTLFKSSPQALPSTKADLSQEVGVRSSTCDTLIPVMFRVTALTWMTWASVSLLNNVSGVPPHTAASLTSHLVVLGLGSLYSLHLCHEFLVRHLKNYSLWTVTTI